MQLCLLSWNICCTKSYPTEYIWILRLVPICSIKLNSCSHRKFESVLNRKTLVYTCLQHLYTLQCVNRHLLICHASEIRWSDKVDLTFSKQFSTTLITTKWIQVSTETQSWSLHSQLMNFLRCNSLTTTSRLSHVCHRYWLKRSCNRINYIIIIYTLQY